MSKSLYIFGWKSVIGNTGKYASGTKGKVYLCTTIFFLYLLFRPTFIVFLLLFKKSDFLPI